MFPFSLRWRLIQLILFFKGWIVQEKEREEHASALIPFGLVRFCCESDGRLKQLEPFIWQRVNFICTDASDEHKFTEYEERIREERGMFTSVKEHQGGNTLHICMLELSQPYLYLLPPYSTYLHSFMLI